MSSLADVVLAVVVTCVVLLLAARVLVSILPAFLRRRPRRSVRQRFRVVGVGGGGSNAVTAMARDRVKGVEYLAINTDVQALRRAAVDRRIAIGRTVTGGLGTGGDPDLGRRAAEEDGRTIAKALRGSQLVFLTAGLGGGTGSGAGPAVASIARDEGALTVAIVTLPFAFEGARRREVADAALAELRGCVDTLITVPNDRVLAAVPGEATLASAFGAVDDVLRDAVAAVIDVVAVPGLINLDFADIRAVLRDGGAGVIGTGRASGEGRAGAAAREAIAATLLEQSFHGARGVILNVTGADDLRLVEIVEAAETVRAECRPDANVIFGATFDRSMGDEIAVTVIATGFEVGAPGTPRAPAPEAAPAPEPAPLVPDAGANGHAVVPSRSAEADPVDRVDPADAADELDVPTFLRRPPGRPVTRRRASGRSGA